MEQPRYVVDKGTGYEWGQLVPLEQIPSKESASGTKKRKSTTRKEGKTAKKKVDRATVACDNSDGVLHRSVARFKNE